MQVELCKVVENKLIAKKIYKMIIQGDIVNKMNVAGQFVNIKITDSNRYLLRRPISICEINKNEKTFVIIYRVEGEGTKKISKLKSGDKIDILGPLGNGYELNSLKKGQIALLVGGGIGVPPLYELSKQFNKAGIKTIHILGFNTKEEVFYKEKFEKLGNTYISTVDGSMGEKGYVTDLLLKSDFEYDKYYSCGPFTMLKALKNIINNKDGFLSLEERMACGVGACYACVMKTTLNTVARVCYDGPVFKAEQIIT